MPPTSRELTLNLAAADAPPIRRPLATCDPDVLGLYERLVAADEGLTRFIRACVEEENVTWLNELLKVRDLVDRAKRRVEGLK